MSATSAEIPTWASALGRIPSGLFILTVRSEKQETGMLASWVQQCSFEPPQVSVAIRKGRYLLDWITEETAIAINVLAEGQKSLLAHFGKGFEPDAPAFEGITVHRHHGSAPLLDEALAYLDCRVARQFDCGDHVLVICKVIGGQILHEGRPSVHIRRNGLNY